MKCKKPLKKRHSRERNLFMNYDSQNGWSDGPENHTPKRPNSLAT